MSHLHTGRRKHYLEKYAKTKRRGTVYTLRLAAGAKALKLLKEFVEIAPDCELCVKATEINHRAVLLLNELKIAEQGLTRDKIPAESNPNATNGANNIHT